MMMILDTPYLKLFHHIDCLIIAENSDGLSWYWQIYKEWKETVLPLPMNQETLNQIAEIAEGKR